MAFYALSQALAYAQRSLPFSAVRGNQNEKCHVFNEHACESEESLSG
jgi:hypothetical protein